MRVISEERELAGVVRGGELLQHKPPEQLGEHEYRQEEVGRGRNPVLAVRGEATARYDHVHMRMVRHGRAQVCSTEVMAMRAPRCFGSAAIASIVSAEALNSRSWITRLFW